MTLKKILILQSNYIPWKGYFDMIACADELIIYDDMQYTRRDWRNCNQIKTPDGLQWLTVPVRVKGKYYQKIRETETDGNKWQKSHWSTLVNNYRQAKYFDEIILWLEPLYNSRLYTHLSQLNRCLIEAICSYLSINTVISNSWNYELVGNQSERLANLCNQADGEIYISGPSAKNYIEEKPFLDFGIELLWFDYEGYTEYPQLWGSFKHNVTILDLLFNCGKNSTRYMKNIAK